MSMLLDSVIGSYEEKSGGEIQASPKALAWARVSTDMQEERGLSMPEQLRQIREYAEANGIEILEEYHEAASAFKKNSHRDEFDKMLARAKSDKTVNAILVHDYSRFSRDSLGARLLVRELLQAGVRVISLNDMEVDTESVAGVYMEAITFAKNEAYSREIAFHTKKGCRANIQARDPETGWCYKNGGQPLWGYRSERFQRGEVKRGRPLIKSIWVHDDTVVAGKPIREWARYCLVELAAKGAALDELRDFCNLQGIPAPRQKYWGSTTWHSLLQPNCILQYAGYGVWNVRGKSQRRNPPGEWTIVPNAHLALITEEEAQAILSVRGQRPKMLPKEAGAMARSKGSRFMLSGGLLKCGRCGANMAGFTSTNGRGRKGDYYVCGTAQYRRSLGCGPGVYLDKQIIEDGIIQVVMDRFGEWSDPKVMARFVNNASEEADEKQSGARVDIDLQLAEIEAKLSNIRKAIEDGLADVSWANNRLGELTLQRDGLMLKLSSVQTPVVKPQLDIAAVKTFQNRFLEIRDHGEKRELKELLRLFVDSIEFDPEEIAAKQNEPAAHKIKINVRALPTQFVKALGAGVGFEPTTFGL